MSAAEAKFKIRTRRRTGVTGCKSLTCTQVQRQCHDGGGRVLKARARLVFRWLLQCCQRPRAPLIEYGIFLPRALEQRLLLWRNVPLQTETRHVAENSKTLREEARLGFLFATPISNGLHGSATYGEVSGLGSIWAVQARFSLPLFLSK